MGLATQTFEGFNLKRCLGRRIGCKEPFRVHRILCIW
jgi:hypothetical protein